MILSQKHIEVIQGEARILGQPRNLTNLFLLFATAVNETLQDHNGDSGITLPQVWISERAISRDRREETMGRPILMESMRHNSRSISSEQMQNLIWSDGKLQLSH